MEPPSSQAKKRRSLRHVSFRRLIYAGQLLGENRARCLATTGIAAKHTKSPEVMLLSFISASSSLLDPRRPALVASLRVATRDLCSGSGLTANRTNQFNASGLYLAFDGPFSFSSTSALL